MKVLHSDPIYFSGSFWFISASTVLNSIFTANSFFTSRTLSNSTWVTGSFLSLCFCSYTKKHRHSSVCLCLLLVSFCSNGWSTSDTLCRLIGPLLIFGCLSKPPMLFLGRSGFTMVKAKHLVPVDCRPIFLYGVAARLWSHRPTWGGHVDLQTACHCPQQ